MKGKTNNPISRNRLCVVCKTNVAAQEHHVSYEPELKISVCVPCHKQIHKTHGVGKGKSELKLIIPFYTYMDKTNTVKDLETDEILDCFKCGCNEISNKWEIYGRHDKSQVYLRCRICGKDYLITTCEKKCIPSRSEIKLDNFSIQQRDDEQK
jgi:hypothetical protein